jgi:thiol-disulfide isomerase/thioredoxin
VKKILPLMACLALATISLSAADATENVRKAPELAFSVPGKGQQLLSQYRGKVLAVEFIFTTCPHCQAASKLMTKLQTEYGARGLQVIDIAINQNADLLVDNFAKDFQVNFPVGWATSEQMQSFMGFTSGRYVVPQLALIDRKGNIHWQTPATEDANWDNIMKEDNIRHRIEELLSQPASSAATRTSRLASAKPAS